MKLTSTYEHTSVLIHEIIEYLAIKPNKTYLDATFGKGGHTEAILQQNTSCKVIAIDWDKEALERNQPRLHAAFGNRITTIWGNFAHLYRLLKKENITTLDGILADFGTSQFQIQHKPGFSIYKDSPLDMRMSPAHQTITAADIVNKWTEKKLSTLLYTLGQEHYAKKIAHAIVEKRKQTLFTTTRQLAHFIEKVLPSHAYANRIIHPATKVFQALRIYVNNELKNITFFLNAALPFLAQKGRFVCISFHSLEDRLVKNFFQEHQDQLIILTKKPITPTQKEQKVNRSARSAKLRAAEKK